MKKLKILELPKDKDFIIVIPKLMDSASLKKFANMLSSKLGKRKGKIFVVNTPLYIKQQFIHKKDVKELIDEQPTLESVIHEDSGEEIVLPDKWIDRDKLKKELELD